MVTHIKHLIENFIKKKYKKDQFYKEIEKIINTILDRKILKFLKFTKSYKNTIILYCNNSSVAYEVNLKKNILLEAIKKKFSEIQDIKIKVK